MLAIRERLAADQAQLVQALGLASCDARLEAQLLMAAALDVNRAWLLAHDDEMLAPPVAARYTSWLKHRLTGEPIAYIFGEKEFYGLMFKVSPAVLIPRPETELLVELALARIPVDRPCRVLDLGTGSGIIAITLAKLRPLAELVAVDVSPEALELAQANARNLKADNVQFIESDWFSALNSVEKFDVIVSNPPYIAANDLHLTQGDLRFEPINALAAGGSGRVALEVLIQTAARHLKPEGWLLLEHGYDQGEYTRNALAVAGFGETQTYPDLARVDRVSIGCVD
ncbi:protein-N(5)-glutamine methyltransferase PrmC, methylates polypeptide chain release factors RF1 and RF2 [Sulfuriferula multivorans]|uniref:Release factor glutamine methyltransferase n=1 Tax=Sulfuriferula multivorans TaxID=1559896 RepID=A0A401J9J6_9PROT|nr:peptide chain release factor N(5)-glutamine methyltransferase [Sulfuriferula multivorans]GBL44234.1 protein-N(5)-glutamine methyltransferase PrmC, methylates polypeptide chain release factors RF1 and RF2 [Sulfuriferula multivorans]